MSHVMIDWNELQPVLTELYALEGKSERLAEDVPGLEEAFRSTEKLWQQNFDQMSEVRYVLLGESPVADKYIYNEAKPLTIFFHHRLVPRVESVEYRDKAFLLPLLRESGFLVLDVFPFALGERTALSYPGRIDSVFNLVFEALQDRYLWPKLELIRTKAIPSVQFAWRYKKHRALSDRLAACLKEFGLLSPSGQIGCVGSSNMPIDANALEAQFAKVRLP